MFLPKAVNNVVNILREPHPYIFLLCGRSFRPSRFSEIAVVVPLQEGDVILGNEFIEPMKHVITHIVTPQVEHKLVSRFGPRTAFKVHRPVGMFSIEIAVGIDHFRFDPDSKIHPQVLNMPNEWAEATGKLGRVYVPVTKTCVIVVTLPEPTVVHNKTFDSQAGSFVRKSELSCFVQVKVSRFPGVVDNRACFQARPVWQYFRAFELVESARGAADSLVCIPGKKRRCGQRFSRRQVVSKVKGIVPSRDSYLLVRVLLDTYAPAATPSECPEPDRSMLTVGVTIPIECKPWVHLDACTTSSAFQYLDAGVHRFLIELPLTRPAAREVTETVTLPTRQIPRRRLCAFEHNRTLRSVFDCGIALDDARLRIDEVVEMNQQGPFNIFESNRQSVSIDLMIHIVENQIAVAIGERNLETRFGKQTSAPSRVFLWCCGRAEVEGCPFRKALRCRKIIIAPNMLAPINVLQHVFVIYPKNVGAISRV